VSMPPARRVLRWRAAILVSVVAICIADGLTSAGVVVGILLCIPIVLASTDARAAMVLWTGALAGLGFTVAALVGAEPISPAAVWIPNRIFAALSIPAATLVGLLLQRRRTEAERARDAALSASELNRLIGSLLAHDLRVPLTLAADCLRYVRDASARAEPLDGELLAETDERLRRSLRAVEGVLALARGAAAAGSAAAAPPREELADEVAGFEAEARARGKRIVLDVAGVRDGQAVDARVLRHVLATLLDNALRYAAPGQVTVSAWSEDGQLAVRVSDGGPASSSANAVRGRTEAAGAGVGRQLATALAEHAGGSLRPDGGAPGTSWVLRLPAKRPAEAGPPSRGR
jgi:K+-sensing histidine kinase KdpD